MRRRLRRIRQAARAELHQAAGRPRLQETSRRDRRRHRCAGDALQGAAPRARESRRNRRGDRRRRRARHPPIDDGEMGEGARHRRRHQAGEIRRLPEGGRRRGGRCQRGPRRRAVAGSDRAGRASMWWSITSRPPRRSKPAPRRSAGAAVSSRSAAPASRSRLSAADLLNKEQDVLGSRYVTRSEVLESLDLVARGEVFPLVTVVRPLEEAEAVHELVERGEVIGRAALRVAVRQHTPHAGERSTTRCENFCSALRSLACLPQRAHAQSYPDRPIKLLVPLAAGSAVDIVARLVADKMGDQLGQRPFVENMAGGAGVIGMRAGARAGAGRLHRDRAERQRADHGAEHEVGRRLRSVRRLHAGDAARRHSARPDRASVVSGQQRRRADRAGEEDAGRHQLFVRRARAARSTSAWSCSCAPPASR